MSVSLRIKPLLAAVAVVAALLIGGLAGAAITRIASGGAATATSPTTSPNRVGALAGGWRMTSLEVGTNGDLQAVPYSGQIVFDPSGRVAVQAMNPATAAADTEFTIEGYEAWAGQATLDQSASTFTARVDSSVARDMIGTDQARRFEVTPNTLVLTPADGSGGFRATYERY